MKTKKIIYRVVLLTVIFFTFLTIISCAGIREWKVVGTSMFPALQNDQIYLGNNNSSSISRGDIIIFYASDRILVKRVIGLPGEKITIKLPFVMVDTQMLEEPYLLFRGSSDTIKVYEVPLDEFFVLGDNRPDSLDSRVFGFVKRKNIIGKVLFRIW